MRGDGLNLARGVRSAPDRWLTRGLRLVATGTAGLLGLIVAFVLGESLPALRELGLLRFVRDASWHPSADAAAGTFQLGPMLAGTLLTTAGAVALAAPAGVLSALFCHFAAPPSVARIYRWMMGLMAGVPSVVYGLWGLVVLVPLLARIEPPGASLLAGIAILTLMIVPTVALLSDAALAAVPREDLLAAAALGLSRQATALWIALPAARSGVTAAVVLALVRALGETMAVLMVCGNVVQVPRSLFDPVRTLTATIALEMGYAEALHRSALFVCGLVLLATVVLLLVGVELAPWRRSDARS